MMRASRLISRRVLAQKINCKEKDLQWLEEYARTKFDVLKPWSDYFLGDIENPDVRYQTALHMNDSHGGLYVSGLHSLRIRKLLDKIKRIREVGIDGYDK